MSFTSDRTRSHVWDLPGNGPRLVVLWDGGSVIRTLRSGERVVIGRGDDCDVQVLHPSVSRRHVELAYGPPLTVRDLGSANGTRLGGRAVLKSAEAQVALGEAIEAGAAMIVVQPDAADVIGHASPNIDDATSPSIAMDRARQLTKLVAPTDIPVLLLGETGVGKEITASAIHAASPRANARLVRINCAAFTEALLESELFGHERGAFTGAVAAKPGLLEEAHGGTLFLDEVGELPASLQAKLLRVLEDREVRRVGATKPRSVDVRFIAATNRDLPAEVQRGAFRADLYFRLNGVAIRIPPLRERTDEIVPLAERFLSDACMRLGRAPLTLSPDVMRALTAYAWPGNVRELRNVLDRAVLLSGGGPIGLAHLVFEEHATAAGGVAAHARANEALPAQIERLERERVVRALDEADGNQTVAARLLGITRRQLIGRIEAFGLPRPRKKGDGP